MGITDLMETTGRDKGPSLLTIVHGRKWGTGGGEKKSKWHLLKASEANDWDGSIDEFAKKKSQHLVGGKKGGKPCGTLEEKERNFAAL